MTTPSSQYPEFIDTEQQLDDVMTCPGAALIEAIKSVRSPLLVLGAGGKMGPTLALLAKRAAEVARHPLEVIAVSRFGDASKRSWLESHGVRTIPCDLLDRSALRQLPEAEDIIYMVGLKFGTAQNPANTWAINTLVPPLVLERYPRSRMVALSTGNVYPLGEVSRGGSLETDSLTPAGEYANATVGRERVFEFCATRQQNQVALIRLFYAVELRYGVLVDIARKVYAGEPVDLTCGYLNCIWQGDANDMIVRSLPLASSPPSAWNLCCPETLQVRKIAERLGELLGKPPKFTGKEAPTALLGNSAKLCQRLGPPSVTLDTLLHWIAHWIKKGGRSLGKPTHFEVRDGKY